MCSVVRTALFASGPEQPPSGGRLGRRAGRGLIFVRLFIQLSALVVLLSPEFRATAADAEPPVARAPKRRLCRIEYEQTLRDLLALPGLAVRDMLPEDGRAHGYDKAAAALDISHVHMAGYYAAAEMALALATAPQPRPPAPYQEKLLPGAQEFFKLALVEGDAVFLKGGAYDAAALPLVREALPHKLDYYEKAGLFPYKQSVGVFRRQGPDDHFALSFTGFSPIRAGIYRLKLSVWSFQWEKAKLLPRPAPEGVSLHANDRLLGYFPAPSLAPTIHTFDVWLNPGERLLFTAASLPAAKVYQLPGRAAEYVGPGVAIDFLEVSGPLAETWPPASHRLLYGELPLDSWPKGSPLRPPKHAPAVQIFPEALPKSEPSMPAWGVMSAEPAADAKRLLQLFLFRAYRRPATAAEVAGSVALVQRRMKQGEPFEQALRGAYQAALCAPEFLFIGGGSGPLDDWALATRLSYFLWDSMPDDELFTLARRRQLRRPEVLAEQVERMLADAKSERFIDHFLDEWLDLREIDFTTPDATLYPEYSQQLRDAMLAETRAYFRELIRHDEPPRALVDADFVMVNQRLAEHYQLGDLATGPVAGTALRKVSVPVGGRRGGLLGQASVLKVTSNGTVTSPVKRGAWVLRELLDEPPEPPPPGVPAVDADVRGTVTIREQLARHAEDSSCASCHAAIDPPGFALESFDVIGGWRERYRVLPLDGRLDREGPPVDPSCLTSDGRPCATFEEFKQTLAANPRRLARAFLRQLLVYATGTPPTAEDREELARIVAESEARGGGVRSLIQGLVASRLFLEQ